MWEEGRDQDGCSKRMLFMGGGVGKVEAKVD